MKTFYCFLLLSLTSLLLIGQHAGAQTGVPPAGQLSWALHYDPQTFDPALVADEASETVRALTGGKLVRVDRHTLKPLPQLAESYSITPDGRSIRFNLRSGLKFSDGSALTSSDVAWTLRHILDPKISSPKASLFPAGTDVTTPSPNSVIVRAPSRIDSPEWAFDEISIQPAGRGADETVTAGPFSISKHIQGQSIELARNPHYWRQGYPRVGSIRLEILANREQEMLRLVRGQYQFADPIPPADFASMNERATGIVRDEGTSLETEQLWFNESPHSPLPAYKLAWFSRREFRVAVSQAINRSDLARIAYDGHATPADGFYSPAGGTWRSQSLKAPQFDPVAAAKVLAGLGWKLKNGVLTDEKGYAVEFSIVSNAGNAPRGKMLAMIQQDLSKLGIKVNIVTLDFPALIERLTSSFNYDACLLGTTNATPSPESTRNIWLSSSPDHQWNPKEDHPSTSWEADLDRELHTVDTSLTFADRKRSFDHIQQIIADQQPMIYLVYRNRISGISPKLTGVQPSVLAPPWWNIEEIGVKP